MFIGEVIGGLGSLLGGWLGSESQKDINAKNIAMQQQFAQQGIRWKVADAKAAGIHPLYALGAQTHSFQNLAGDSSMGDAVKSASQNFGRAAQAAMTAKEREATNMLTALQLEKAGLENDLLRTEVIGKKRAMLGPALPGLDGKGAALAGQGDARKYSLAHDIPLQARGSETKAEKLEDEYGDESIINFINNNYRQLRDLIESGRSENLKNKIWGSNSDGSARTGWQAFKRLWQRMRDGYYQ